ncbi:zinc ribbon domain-containing protein [Oceanobacillus bengalensis]|uniref:Zinc ribbon domain-containing protein n=1 Tax=Oceanobacillus bengalensis TaxID=1435466 RepID=A0A494YSF0_9BACI|nr:zinc ribbon domain-containing protein [Oceanobacillus bengalensis]RKQ12811.1 zinc ribbon domain-containing protein [Oceanobacillus bengalensis]
MICHSCHQETLKGKFCSNCGAALIQEEITTEAIPSSTTTTSIQTIETETPQENKSKEILESMKEEVFAFGRFFIQILKNPSKAKNLNSKHWISGLIMFILFALFNALSNYLTLTNSFFRISFMDGFLIPFIQLLALFGVIAALTFIGLKIGEKSPSFLEILAKVGAYLIPFFVLFIISILLTLIGLNFAASMLMLTLIGPLLLIPTFIILEQPNLKLDRIYILIGIYILALIISSLIYQSPLLGGFSPF